MAKEIGEEISDEDFQMILEECDHDRDGEIGADDWVRVMRKSVRHCKIVDIQKSMVQYNVSHMIQMSLRIYDSKCVIKPHGL